jgi:hypothetical protein
MLAQWIKRCVATLVTAGALCGGAAMASEPYCPPTYVTKRVVCYETVTVYETHREAYQVCVTRYDSCGAPYHVYKTCYRDVRTPVQKQIAVTQYVNVPVD